MTARQDYPSAGWTSFTTWTGRTFRPVAPASASRRVKAARGQAAGTAARREGVSARRRSLRSVRGLPSLLIYRHALPVRQRGEMTFITATTMPLLIALAVIGLSDGVMIPANAAALVGAGVLSVLVYPSIAARVARRGRAAAGAPAAVMARPARAARDGVGDRGPGGRGNGPAGQIRDH
jgi:hypothetical protein